ncbi:MAG: class I SAM-dependent methyltransferase, partial [Thermoplasmata archaeon]
MKVEWRVDPVVNRALWERLSLFPRELMSGISPRVVLDLGGGSGDFASSLLQDGRTMVISLDTDLDVLKKRVKGVQAVLGDATSLPIKDSSVGGVTARAVLHHFPKDAEKCLFEAERVLKGGGLFLVQEPLSHNFLANIARRYFLTKRHETGEEPFDPSQLKTILSNHFQPQWKE